MKEGRIGIRKVESPGKIPGAKQIVKDGKNCFFKRVILASTKPNPGFLQDAARLQIAIAGSSRCFVCNDLQ